MRIALLAVMLGGCSLYFGGGGGGGMDAGICNVEDYPAQQERDPYTGQCETVGSTGCGPANGQLTPNWASCTSSCLGHNQASCTLSAGCQVELLGTSYWGCFPVEPGDLAPPQDCTKADTYSCTQNDACIAVYATSSTGGTSFVECLNEMSPAPACSTLTTEAACLMRSDCDAVYVGSDCTCDRSGCTCQTETFASCQ